MSISRPDSPTTTTTTTHHPPPRIEDVVLEAPKLRRTQSVVTPSYLTSFIRWVQLKKYQYEVTFSLYMLTPAEKAIFSKSCHSLSDPISEKKNQSILFLFTRKKKRRRKAPS